MNALNPALMWGMAALAIPIIIHLFHKSRFKVVKWGAMHLLAAVVRTNQKRIKIEQWILLAIRCAIPLFLALMMARLAWQGMKKMLGDDPTSSVVLLDNSYSMEAGRAGTTNFSAARDETQRMVSGLKRGSEAYVFLMGEGGGLLDQPTRDLSRVTQELDKVSSGYGVARVPAALDLVSGTVEKMKESARQLIVMTDFQKMSFPAEEQKLLVQAIDRLKKLPIAPTITFWDVGVEAKDNVAVESLDFSKLMVGVGQKVQIRANLRNYGDSSRSDLAVVLRVDGAEKSKSQIKLDANSQNQVLFTHVFDKAGSHVVEIATEDVDAVKADNSFLASIPVRDSLNVLLVDGSPGASPSDLKGETGYAQIALSPFMAGKVEQGDLIKHSVKSSEATTAKDIAEASVVVLANVGKLTDEQLKALDTFVRQGGGLLTFAGDKTDAAWWNGPFAALAPLPMGTIAGDATAKDDAATGRLAEQRYDNPALELFNDPRNGKLTDVGIKAWYRFKQPTRTGGIEDPVVLARMDNGDPFLAERSVGEGRVISCATSLDTDWSNFPVRPSYLPLLQRLCVYLASNVYPPRNLRVGDLLVSFVPAAAAGQKATITLPDTSNVEVDVIKRGERGIVELPKTQRPGLYTLTLASMPKDPIHYVVNTDRAESDLTKLSESEIDALGKALDVKIIRTAEELKSIDQVQRYGHEVWKWLLVLLLIFLFLELILQHHFASGRSKS